MLYKIKNSFFKRAFPTPKYLSLDPVSVDISPYSIKIMKLKSTPVGFIPESYSEIVFTSPCDLTDDISEEESKIVTTALAKLKKEFNFNYAVVSLPEQRNYLFQTTMPVQAKEEIVSSVELALSEYVPLEARDLNFDFSIINSETNRKEMDVVVSVYQKKLIRTFTKIFKDADITPVSFISEATAMSNSLIDCCDLGSYLIIRIMKDRVNIVIVENSVVQYTSTVMLNAEEFIKNFSGQPANDLKESLNKLLIYWFTNKQGIIEHKKIEQVILTGSYASREGVIDFFEGNLKIHTDLGNVWRNAFDLAEHIPRISKDDSHGCAVVMGLALAAVINK